MSEPKGRGAVWTEERSDEGRRSLQAPRRRAGKHSMSEPKGRGAVWTEERSAPPDSRRPSRPGRQTRPGWPVQPPKSPVRPASPVRPPGPGRSGRPVKTSATVGERIQAHLPMTSGIGQVSQVRRTSFGLLVLGLLGGGLVCLLVVNTTLAANSIEIRKLQRQNAVRSEQVQELQQQVATAGSPSVIAKEARRLGMRPVPELIFLDLRTKSIEAPRGAAAAALAARLAAGWPTGGQAGPVVHRGTSKRAKKSRSGRPGQ